MGRILRGNEVVLDGQFHLDLTRAQLGGARGRKALSDPAARIVESHSDFAILEIICSCGERLHVRCGYADVEASAERPEQNKTSGEKNNEG